MQPTSETRPSPSPSSDAAAEKDAAATTTTTTAREAPADAAENAYREILGITSLLTGPNSAWSVAFKRRPGFEPSALARREANQYRRVITPRVLRPSPPLVRRREPYHAQRALNKQTLPPNPTPPRCKYLDGPAWSCGPCPAARERPETTEVPADGEFRRAGDVTSCNYARRATESACVSNQIIFFRFFYSTTWVASWIILTQYVVSPLLGPLLPLVSGTPWIRFWICFFAAYKLNKHHALQMPRLMFAMHATRQTGWLVGELVGNFRRRRRWL